MTAFEPVAGQVVAAYGRRYLVATAAGELSCVTRGKRGGLACGDRVTLSVTAPGDGVIESVSPRSTLFYRADAQREKLIAANVAQVVVVVATAPAFLPELIDRCLVAAEHAGARALIVLNKCDLIDALACARSTLARYRALGYDVLEIAAHATVEPLRARLAGHASVLVGQSGMGKSTIVNRLVPQADARTADPEHATSTGRHTTTHARLHALPDGGSVIDSPGMQVFGVSQVEAHVLAQAFVEMRPLLGQCRFRDCRHVSEPDCAITAAVRSGAITPERLNAYRSILRELEHRPRT